MLSQIHTTISQSQQGGGGGGRLLLSLQSATPTQTENSDEGVKNWTENSLLLLNYDVF